SAAERERLRRVPTTSGEALLAYSRARALLDHADKTGNPEAAADLLRQAIARDASFALAYAALADAYWAGYQRTKDPAVVEKATAAVREALRIDPNQAAVHYSLGAMQDQLGREVDAIESFKRALRLQPDNDDAH